ncbi:unnamed protein product [Callosobruchus maculatus]|uniref:Uncharacterized protein n=1 Tax=Callosobruchus maculatus TaxID=64391 RepID=A0A653BT07_CALMS|nr:unnamed protein product [Callosobruchus maculatus]
MLSALLITKTGVPITGFAISHSLQRLQIHKTKLYHPRRMSLSRKLMWILHFWNATSQKMNHLRAANLTIRIMYQLCKREFFGKLF